LFKGKVRDVFIDKKELYLPLLKRAGVTEVFVHNIEQIFEKSGVEVSFGQINVIKWLDCSKSKATNLMRTMKAAKIIRKVTGKGPGKYEFIKIEE
jgi:hypothetical protein